MNQEIKKLTEQAKKHAEQVHGVIAEIKKVIVGQDEILQRVMISLIADGHVLIEGVPGLAKTLIVKTLSDTIKTRFQRIQFTPDLLPADILGTKIFNMKNNTFTTKKGPIFANIILADEINRAPPKCQSALLEAMQERQVTIGENTYTLDKPFLVLATMNPLEHEGVYILPEAQVDRFMFKLIIRYPKKDEEKEIISRMTGNQSPAAKSVISPQDIMDMQKFCREIYVDEKIRDYVADIVHATRHHRGYGGLIECGASPRASIWLIMAGKAHALINGRGYVVPEDIKAVAHDVIRHRIILSYEAEAEEVTTDIIIDKVIDEIKVP
ncbi:MAG: MoxR family ATPase [archaeon]